MFILFMNLQSVQGLTETVYFCSTQHLLGQLKDWGLKSSEKLTHLYACTSSKLGKLNQLRRWNSWGSSGIPPLTLCSLPCDLPYRAESGTLDSGLTRHRSQERRKTRRKLYCLLWPHLGSHPSVIPPHSIDLPRFKEWEQRSPTSRWRTVKRQCFCKLFPVRRAYRIGYILVGPFLENVISHS